MMRTVKLLAIGAAAVAGANAYAEMQFQTDLVAKQGAAKALPYLVGGIIVIVGGHVLL